jgi:hypothetical protein
MNYTWEILKLETQEETSSDGTSLTDSIVRIDWRRRAVDDDGTEASYKGVTHVSASSTLAEDFIALAAVQKSHVVSWIESNMSDGDVVIMNKTLQDKINTNRTARSSFKPAWD